jgi:NADH-quinone oxidoreductase subunit J
MAATDLLFAGFAAVGVVSALLVVTRKNPVYSALFLILCFLAIAGIAVLLHAPFLAGMHVLVYAGAIMVLFLFVILLLNLKPEELGGEYPLLNKAVAGLLSAGLFALLAVTFARDPSVNVRAGPVDKEFGSVRAVGLKMFDDYLLPFELVSILIMVAIFGAVVLARRKAPREGA